AHYVSVDTLPLTSSGKVHRQSLPAPDDSRPELGASYVAPRSPIEQQLAAIWSDVLGIERVGVHDNFFELGGHSLMAINMFARMEEVLGRKLPVALIFQHHTIAGIAGELILELPDSDAARVLELRKGGVGRPLFVMPGVTGNPLMTKSLLDGVTVPLLGVQPSLDKNNLERFRDFRQMARCLADALQKHQPRGPYSLVGFSFGGMMAFEVARVLTEGGQTVDLLAIVDTGPNRRGLHVGLGERFMHAQRVVANLPGWCLEECRRFSAGQFAARFTRFTRRHFRRVSSRGKAGVVYSDVWNTSHLDPEAVERYEASFQSFCEYLPSHYRGRIDLLSAKTQSLLLGAAEDRGWRRFSNEVLIHKIAGDHESMLKSPNIETLITRLNELLERRPEAGCDGSATAATPSSVDEPDQSPHVAPYAMDS
ncbi:MAG: thioesterase domain-containing protein, partial [Rubripirellula sp.]